MTASNGDEGELMADKAMDTYLNDHLAGAMFGSDLAGQIASQIEDAEHANRFRNLAQQIESDRLDVVWVDGPARYHEESGQAGHDVAGGELSNVTLTGVSSGESELGLFMAIETLSLGVEGKHPCGGC